MRPRDWMGVVVRGIGIWFLLNGLYQFFSFVMVTVRPAAVEDWKPIDYVLSVVMHFLVGLIAIGCAESICSLLYPAKVADVDLEPRE